jgi:hypothetical protein
MAMKISLGTLAMAGALALALVAAPTLASAADFFGIPIPGTDAPLPPPLDLNAPVASAPPPPAPDALAGAYVPMPPPGMVTYPGYQSAYKHGLPRRLLGTQADLQCGRTADWIHTPAIHVPTVVLTTRGAYLFALQV